MLRFLDSLFFHLFSQQVQGICNWGTVLVFQTKLQFLPLVRGATHSQLSISVTFSGSPGCCHLREFILHTEVFLDMIIVIIIDHKGILWISLTVFSLVSQLLTHPAPLVLKDSFKSRLTFAFSYRTELTVLTL